MGFRDFHALVPHEKGCANRFDQEDRFAGESTITKKILDKQLWDERKPYECDFCYTGHGDYHRLSRHEPICGDGATRAINRFENGYMKEVADADANSRRWFGLINTRPLAESTE